MTTKLVVLSEIIAPYRIPVFNALALVPEISLHVVFLSETDDVLRQWHIYTDEIRFSYEVLPSWRWRAGRRSLLLNRGLRVAFSAAAPDAILCGGYNYPASWESLVWARRNKIRFILWTESNERDQRSGYAGVEWLKRYFVRSCHAFVVPGKSSLAYVRKLGASESVIFTAPNAVDNSFFAMEAEKVKNNPDFFRRRFDLPRRFILFAGRLVPEKGVFDLLEAYAKLENGMRSDVGLVFAGDGSAREQLAQRAKQISPGTICFSGFVQKEDLPGFYALAEALVLPTHSDPWGLVVNEAMACGLPIVVSDAAGCAADLVGDGWNGYVVPPRDAERLGVAINNLIRQPQVVQQMSWHSLQRIQDYSPGTCARSLAAAAIGPAVSR
jgi:glycosyltransferase involved in cell wall biosynthesis